MRDKYKLNSEVLLELLIRAYWMEKEAGEELWTKLPYASDDVRKVANVLKEDEVRHERILKGILRRVKRIPHSYIEKKVKELGSLSPMIPSEGSDTLGEILEKMINFEKSMRDLYRMLENVEDEAITYAFEILADDFRSMIHSILADEEDHIQLLRSLIEPRFF